MQTTIFDIPGAAEFSGYSRHAIRWAVKSGKLQAFKIRRKWLVEAMQLRNWMLARR
jgi:Helix-turn-helix domain